MRPLRFALFASAIPLALAAGCASGRPETIPQNDASVDANRPRDTGVPVDAPCAPSEQRCAGSCRAVDDPDYGCGDPTCMPCAPPDGAVGRCEAGACAFDCAAGRIDLDGDPANGCEYACARSGDLDLVDAALVDANCDGSDGVLASCIFVSAAHGDDASADGTTTAPFGTIGAALAAASTIGRRSVCVAGGDYPEALVIPGGVDLLGGFDDADATFPYRRSATATTTVHAIGAVLTIPDASAPAQIAGLTITSEAAGSDGSSYGVLVLAGTAMLAIDDCVITAADGTDGARGTDGMPASMPASTGTRGTDGMASGSTGGIGATAPGCAERGGRGGDGGFADTDGMMGSTGSGGASGGPIGTASHVCGVHSMPGGTGQAGGSGGAGMAGTGGMGLGTLGASGYVPAAGRMGGSGGNGRGGGGGGGGGGGSCMLSGGCSCMPDRGGGGGSGGCGGVGGPPGLGGGGGGGSFGIVIAEGTVVIDDCTITTGAGGGGGRGGDGASGQLHGDGGPPGAAADDGGAGGMGGPGGDGGAGGPGGGGGGGPSACLARASGASATVATTRCVLGAPGMGGSGGTNSVSAIGGLGTSGAASAQIVLP